MGAKNRPLAPNPPGLVEFFPSCLTLGPGLYGVWISPPILGPAPDGRATSNKILFISVLGEDGTPYMLVREVRTRLQLTLIPRSEPFRLVRFLFSTRACVEYISHSLNS